MKTETIAKHLKTKSKNAIYAVSLILIFAVGIIMGFAPTASAQAGWPTPRTTAGFVSVAPTLIGVGQSATVNLWVLPLPQDYRSASWYGGPHGGSYSGITVTFTKPDGTTDKFTPTDAEGIYPAGYLDPLGTMYFYYSPDEVGNWSVTMSMPAQNFTDATGTVQWTACTSQPFYFTVQTAAVNAGLLNGYPYAPLPNSNVYWTYPINSNNREWSAISGDWLAGALSAFEGGAIANLGGSNQLYGPGPSTGHILWDIPYTGGGIIGGVFGGVSYQPPANTLLMSPIIIAGKLYLTISTDATGIYGSGSTFECIDLATGQVLWKVPGTVSSGIDFPGNAALQSANLFGVGLTGVVLASSYGASPIPYLFQNLAVVWNFYDPNTGALQLSFTNVSASNFYFIDGSPIAYGVTYAGMNAATDIYAVNYVWEWNLTKVVNNDWWTGIVWTHTVNNPAKDIAGPGDGSGRPSLAVSSDLSTIVYGAGAGENLVEGFSTATGQSLWNDTLTYSDQNIFINMFGTNDFIETDPTTATWYLYSDLTGALLWSTPNLGTLPWSTKFGGIDCINDKNNVYIGLPDGSIYALSLATGKVEWKSAAIPSTEYSTNVVPYYIGMLEEGGIVYAYAGYSIAYELNPIPRFAELVAVNATTGATTFTLNGGIYPTGAADGYVVGIGQLDGNYYCIGKGQTSTSVSAPTTAQPLGTAILLNGNVLDESPAQPGTPAVSDSSMSEQMDYLHMQNATLLNSGYTPTGVSVTLTALDPNNNTENIGTYTTDGRGNFAVLWTPPVPGKYAITATFAGTDSYYPSSSETFIAVGPAAAPTTTTTTVVSSGVSATTLYEAIAAVIIVIIVVAIVLAVLMFRKRP